jgi:hypothetical protein
MHWVKECCQLCETASRYSLGGEWASEVVWAFGIWDERVSAFSGIDPRHSMLNSLVVTVNELLVSCINSLHYVTLEDSPSSKLCINLCFVPCTFHFQ